MTCLRRGREGAAGDRSRALEDQLFGGVPELHRGSRSFHFENPVPGGSAKALLILKGCRRVRGLHGAGASAHLCGIAHASLFLRKEAPVETHRLPVGWAWWVGGPRYGWPGAGCPGAVLLACPHHCLDGERAGGPGTPWSFWERRGESRRMARRPGCRRCLTGPGRAWDNPAGPHPVRLAVGGGG